MADLFNLPNLLRALVVLVVIFLPLESFFPLVRRKFWQRPGVWADLFHFFVSGAIRKLLVAIALVILTYWLGFLVYPPLQHWIASWPRGVQLLTAVVVQDIGAYWGHRLAHTVPALWRLHAVHHSSEHLDWLAASRVHPLDQTFIRCCGVLPLYFLGFTAATFGGLIAFDAFLAIFIHANLRWRFGWLAWLVATPAFHHWHHANDGPATANKNFSGFLPLVDWVFGTIHLPRREMPRRYGIDEPMTQNYLGQLVAPFRAPPSAADSPAPATAAQLRPQTEIVE